MSLGLSLLQHTDDSGAVWYVVTQTICFNIVHLTLMLEDWGGSFKESHRVRVLETVNPEEEKDPKKSPVLGLV